MSYYYDTTLEKYIDTDLIDEEELKDLYEKNKKEKQKTKTLNQENN